MGAAAGPLIGGPASSVLSVAGVGLSAMGTYEKAQGQQQADEFQAAELDRATDYGDLKAVQTGAAMTQKLNITLGNIDVMRAAANTDPNSPTGAAVREYSENLAGEQKNITTDNILAQSQQQRADAAYLRVAGSNALLAGKMGAFGQLLGGFGPSAGSGNFGIGSGGGGGGGSSSSGKPSPSDG